MVTWANGTGVRRDLVFHALAQDTSGADVWRPLCRGSYEAVQDEARHFAARYRTRVVIIALREDHEPPGQATERELMRRSEPWY